MVNSIQAFVILCYPKVGAAEPFVFKQGFLGYDNAEKVLQEAGYRMSYKDGVRTLYEDNMNYVEIMEVFL